MSVTHPNAVRSILADAFRTFMSTGSGTALCRCRDSITTIVDFELNNTPFGAAVDGLLTLADTPIPSAVEDEGDLDNGQLINRNGDIGALFSITGTGMGGDLEFDNPSLVDEQGATLSSMTYAASP